MATSTSAWAACARLGCGVAIGCGVRDVDVEVVVEVGADVEVVVEVGTEVLVSVGAWLLLEVLGAAELTVVVAGPLGVPGAAEVTVAAVEVVVAAVEVVVTAAETLAVDVAEFGGGCAEVVAAAELDGRSAVVVTGVGAVVVGTGAGVAVVVVVTVVGSVVVVTGAGGCVLSGSAVVAGGLAAVVSAGGGPGGASGALVVGSAGGAGAVDVCVWAGDSAGGFSGRGVDVVTAGSVTGSAAAGTIPALNAADKTTAPAPNTAATLRLGRA